MLGARVERYCTWALATFQPEEAARFAHGGDLRLEHAQPVCVPLLAGKLEARRVDVVAEEDDGRALGAKLRDPRRHVVLERREHRVDEGVGEARPRAGKLRCTGVTDEKNGALDGGLGLAHQRGLEVRVDVVLASTERHHEAERGGNCGDAV